MFEPSDLNSEQLAAVTHDGGPLLIVAGAGTGKTMTLASRVGWLIGERRVRPERILLLTFSRRASREMLSRAERLSGDDQTGRVVGGTFHAVANRLLRLHGRPLGLRPDFTVLDQGDGADVMDLLRDEFGFSARERRFPRKETLASIYSRTVNAGEKLGDVLKTHYPWCLDEAEGIREVFTAYTTRKREQNVLDYDDLLLFWKALAWAPPTREPLAAMFDHVLVDEYQDTNALQADILEGIRPHGRRNLTVVGDDAQSIYGFRAATVRNILEFPERFPDATVVKLEQNYRSTTPLLAASNAVISLSPQRHEKTLWSVRDGDRLPTLRTCLDEAEQCDAVCENVLRHREEGVPLHRQAVLFRAAHHSDLLEVELARRNIPFVKYGGLKFLEAGHVKDTLGVLRVLENPFDEVSWFRVLQLPDGMGPATARRVMEQIGVRRVSEDQPSPLVNFLDHPIEVPRAALDGVQELRSALRGCADQDVLLPAAQIERLRAFLSPVFARRYDAASARMRDIEQLEVLAQGYETRGRFLSELTLDPPASTGELAGPPLLDEDWLILSTIHSAKGLEWDAVHVIHAADGMIPSDMATGDDDEIAEERRLLYVALTRARDALHVYYPQRYYRRPKGLEDPHSFSQLSRFLPDQVQAVFQQIAPTVVGIAADTPGLTGTANVDGYLAALWSD
ncbi:MAG: ATP-dependent helicase [Actinomycetota bacterium]